MMFSSLHKRAFPKVCLCGTLMAKTFYHQGRLRSLGFNKFKCISSPSSEHSQSWGTGTEWTAHQQTWSGRVPPGIKQVLKRWEHLCCFMTDSTTDFTDSKLKIGCSPTVLKSYESSSSCAKPNQHLKDLRWSLTFRIVECHSSYKMK